MAQSGNAQTVIPDAASLREVLARFQGALPHVATPGGIVTTILPLTGRRTTCSIIPRSAIHRIDVPDAGLAHGVLATNIRRSGTPAGWASVNCEPAVRSCRRHFFWHRGHPRVLDALLRRVRKLRRFDLAAVIPGYVAGQLVWD